MPMPTATPRPRSVHFVNSYRGCIRAAEAIRTEAPGALIPLDLETTGSQKKDGLRPWSRTSKARILSIYAGGRPWVLDLFEVDPAPVLAELNRRNLVMHNTMFDLAWLRLNSGYRHMGLAECTLTAARVLRNGDDFTVKNDLTTVRRELLGDMVFSADQAKSDWSGPLSGAQIDYAADDVRQLVRLHKRLQALLQEEDLISTYHLERDLIPALIDIQEAGMPFDRALAEARCDSLMARCIRLEISLRERMPEPSPKPPSPHARKRPQRKPLNVRSTKQVRLAFRQLGMEPPKSLDEKGLRYLLDLNGTRPFRVSLLRDLLRFRELDKERQLLTSLLEASELTEDGKVRCWYQPLAARTGRFSCKDPNLQQVPRGEFRRIFRAPAGRKLICADLSQIEVRVAGDIASDEVILAAYRDGADLYVRTAAILLQKRESEISDKDRQQAKAVLLGSLYGQGAEGLVDYAKIAFGVCMTLEEATKRRRAFLGAFRGIRRWHQSWWKKAPEPGSGTSPLRQVRTRGGRRRLYERGVSRWHQFSRSVNTEVQGCCADGLKMAMIRLYWDLKRAALDARIVATVHDELILEASEEDAEAALALTIRALEEEMARLVRKVPIIAKGSIVETWAEK